MLMLAYIYREYQVAYIFAIIGIIYLINARLLRKYLSKLSAIFITIFSILLTVYMYDKDIVNVSINVLMIMIGVESIRTTFAFHKKISLHGV